MLIRRFSLLPAAVFACCFVGSYSASAQDEGAIGAEGAVVLPVSDWSDVSGLGLGALIAGHYDTSPELAVTGRIGYIYHFSKSVNDLEFSTYEIPVLGGIKYRFGEPDDGPYFGAEAGFVSLGMKSELTNPFTGQKSKASDSEFKFGVTVGGGYEMDDLDFRGQLFFPDIEHLDDFVGIMATVGYRFARF